MKTHLLITAALTLGLIGSALAQPSTNGPSGTGPEGTTKSAVTGSGMNPPGAKTASPAAKSMKHSKKKSHKSSS